MPLEDDAMGIFEGLGIQLSLEELAGPGLLEGLQAGSEWNCITNTCKSCRRKDQLHCAWTGAAITARLSKNQPPGGAASVL